MKISIMLICFCLFSCIKPKTDNFKSKCPYEPLYDGHFLRIPISIVPHQMQFKVGDTIQINTTFTDSIYDLSTQQTYKIKDFPFKPISLLYRFIDKDTYDSGYRVNVLIIDSIFNPLYHYSSRFTDGFGAYTLYQNDKYIFKSQLILKKPGRYILLFSDFYQINLGTGSSELNTIADAITFEGKCMPYFPVSMIDSGSDHLEAFEDELIYLDQKVYDGKLSYHMKGQPNPLGYGALTVEFEGCFGFEVVE